MEKDDKCQAARWCRGSVIPDTAWSCEEITDSNVPQPGSAFKQVFLTRLAAHQPFFKRKRRQQI